MSGLEATRRIIACGEKELYLPALVDYVLSFARSARPKVLFLPTASGDSAAYLDTFYRAFAGRDCEVTHLALFDRTVADIETHLREQDVIVVGGGNTANMLAIWRVHGVDRALRAAYDEGVVLTGWSAGCICWFEDGTTDSFTPDLGRLGDGLGFLSGSACPHYDAEARRRVVYEREIAAGMAPGIALDDGIAARYEDEHLVEVVSARASAGAFWVGREGERRLEVRSIARDPEEIAAELTAMAEEDQRMRRVGTASRQWDAGVDLRNSSRLSGICAEIGLPTRSRDGASAEHKTWLLGQHAEADVGFQREVLALMRAEPAVEVCPEHLAYLEDRVRTHEGRPQRYGTQLRQTADGGLEALAMEDPEPRGRPTRIGRTRPARRVRADRASSSDG